MNSSSDPDAGKMLAECEVPSGSLLDPQLVRAAYFLECYRARLTRPDASVAEIFFGIFGHNPAWIKTALILRNWVASLCGIGAPTAAEILKPQIKSSYTVGEKIGPWPILSLSETELVAGRDEKHLDFRFSLLKEGTGSSASVVITTICVVNNGFGKLYLFFVVPLHRWGFRRILTQAMLAGRL